MKKIILFFVMYCAAVHFVQVQAQSFAFERNGVELPNNAAYTVTEAVTFPVLTIESELALVNKTQEILNIEVTQTILQAPVTANAWLSICFDQCFTTNENKIITGQLPVRGNEALHCYFNPVAGSNETVAVKYEVKNLNSPTEIIAVTVTYQYGTSSVKNAAETANISVFERDGKTFAKYAFGTQADRQLQIFNITGKRISDVKLERLSATIAFPELTKGIYLYRLIENGKTLKNSKFIIK